MKSYSNRVVATVVENGEEKIIKEDFPIDKGNPAYFGFKNLFSKYENQFITNYSPIHTSLRLFSIATSQGYDFDFDRKIDITYEDPFLLVEISKGVINHDKKLKDKAFLALVQWVQIRFLELEHDGELDNNSGDAEAVYVQNNRSNKYQLIECTRCGKKMEVENDIAKKYKERSNRRKNIVLSCDNCIRAYYKDPMFKFYLHEIYNRLGESQRGESINLIDMPY
jgi:hypothetical protein